MDRCGARFEWEVGVPVVYPHPVSAGASVGEPPPDVAPLWQGVLFRIKSGAPPLTHAVVVGHLARAAAMAWYGRRNGGAVSPLLSGKAPDGTPLTGQRHCFFLPVNLRGGGHIDHLLVYAPAGLGAAEGQALAELRVLRGFGLCICLEPLSVLTKVGLALAGSPWGPSAVWQSVTPYVLIRHPKRFRTGEPKRTATGEQVDAPAAQVRREWEQRRRAQPELPELVVVQPLAAAADGTPWAAFQRRRPEGGGNGLGYACGFRLQFAAPVSGPLALGYGCHFGLGQFAPVRQ